MAFRRTTGPSGSQAPWHVLQQKQPTGDTLTFVDDVSGSLTHTGKSYRGFLALSADAPSSTWVLTVNEEFVAYPYLSE